MLIPPLSELIGPLIAAAGAGGSAYIIGRPLIRSDVKESSTDLTRRQTLPSKPFDSQPDKTTKKELAL